MTTVHEERARTLRHEQEIEDRPGGTRSFSALLRELRDEAVTLVQKELQLARAEISEKITQAQRTASASAVGTGLLMAGVFTLCLAASAGLYAGLLALDVDSMIAIWVAPLAVGLLVSLIGLAMALQAKKLTSADHWRPTRTERSVRETKQWAERKL